MWGCRSSTASSSRWKGSMRRERERGFKLTLERFDAERERGFKLMLERFDSERVEEQDKAETATADPECLHSRSGDRDEGTALRDRWAARQPGRQTARRVGPRLPQTRAGVSWACFRPACHSFTGLPPSRPAVPESRLLLASRPAVSSSTARRASVAPLLARCRGQRSSVRASIIAACPSSPRLTPDHPR